MTLNHQLKGVNQGLQSKGIKFRIEQRGECLNLRGPLPSSNSDETKRIQRISLHLAANDEGLQEAQKILQLVLYQLEHKQFNWIHWRTKKPKEKVLPLTRNSAEVIKGFEKAFFSDPSRRKSEPGSRTTWKSAYLPYLRRLKEKSKELELHVDTKLLFATLTSYEESSRSRKQCATALGALARHLGLELPVGWKALANGYGLHKARFRELPNDQIIKKTFMQIPNPRWRLAYGLMATYGLRNHEVFFCDLSNLKPNGDKILRVFPNTKTGEHQVWPFHPDWFEFFSLEQLGENQNALPKVNKDLKKTTLQQVGRRVAEQFRRYQLPLRPYDLRHAWAVRTILIGLPDTVAARMMGHSVSIHTKTYHHWITRRDQQKAVDAALAKSSY